MSETQFDAARFTDELRARVGAGRADRITQCNRVFNEEMASLANLGQWRNQVDRAWTVMLVRRGIIPPDAGARILDALAEIERGGFALTGEQAIAERAGADAAGLVNIGRTLGEPMRRLKIRDRLMPVFDWLLELREVLLDGAEAHRDAVMPGYTHMCHAQATTYGHWLMSVHDPVERGMVELEAAWRSTNRSSAGCGALAGTSFPIDRTLVADLLGMDGIVENTNDCEASRDCWASVLAALCNLMALISRFAMEMNIWTMEEVRMIEVAPEWCGQSSMMPQKRNFGSVFERARNDATRVFAMHQQALTPAYSTPHGDMLHSYEIAWPTLEGIFCAQKQLGIIAGIIPNLHPVRDRMLHFAREGFSCATELQAELFRRGVLFRRAHTVVAVFVRMAWDAGIPAHQTTGEMLDEAAREVLGEPVGFTTEQVREYLDPRHFVEAHESEGAVSPKRVQEAAGRARERLDEARRRHDQRRRSLSAAAERLDAAAEEIISAG